MYLFFFFFWFDTFLHARRDKLLIQIYLVRYPSIPGGTIDANLVARQLIS